MGEEGDGFLVFSLNAVSSELKYILESKNSL